jgi:hypothetical protein
MGLEDVQVFPSTLVIIDLNLAEMVFDLSKNAGKAMGLGLVSKSEALGWLRGLREDNPEAGSSAPTLASWHVAGSRRLLDAVYFSLKPVDLSAAGLKERGYQIKYMDQWGLASHQAPSLRLKLPSSF